MPDDVDRTMRERLAERAVVARFGKMEGQFLPIETV